MARSQKTRPTGVNVEEFLDAVPDPQRRDDARALCRLLAEITDEPAVLWGSSMVGFGAYNYRYASGHEGTAALVAFAPRKNNLVVYLVSGYEDRYPALVERLGRHRTGKSCLYLRQLADVDPDVLRRLIEQSIDAHRAQDRATAST